MMKFDFGSLGQAFTAMWPVTVQVPLDGGKTEAQEFSVRFLMLSDDEIEVIDEDPKPGHALLRKVVVGLGDGTELTPELLEQLITHPHTRMAMQNAWRQFNLGIAAKN